MNFEILQTGSDGNAVLLNESILLDCGVSHKKLAPHAKRLQLVFCGHSHQDHFKLSTIKKLASERPTLRFCGGEWMAGIFVSAGVPARQIDVLEPDKRYDYGSFSICPVSLYHDVPNFGLKIYMGGESAIYIVDTGYVDHVDATGYDYYLLEANHRESEIADRIAEKQANGEFAYEVRAAKYHLSYEQAMAWLAQNACHSSEYILLHQHKSTEIKGEIK